MTTPRRNAPRRRLRSQVSSLERQLRKAINDAARREREEEQDRLLYQRQAVDALENYSREIASRSKEIDQRINDLAQRIAELDALERLTLDTARHRLGASLLPEPDTRESAIRAAVSALRVTHERGTPLPTDATQASAERLLAALRHSTASASFEFATLTRKTTR